MGSTPPLQPTTQTLTMDPPSASIPAAAAAEAEAESCCPRCQQADFNYEDLDEGTKLVCRDCGYVMDAVVLVHQRTFDEEGALQAGVHVGEADDGRLAGMSLLPVMGDGGAQHLGRGPRRDGDSRQLVLSQNRERLDGGLSYLQLPQAVATAARQLLREVVQAYGAAEPLMQMSPATVAAVVYIAARQQGKALSLGEAAGALDVAGPSVFKEFRRIVQVCELSLCPPSLEATVVHAAARLLPHYLPQLSGPLRRQPLVQQALRLTRLVMDVGAAEGRSPWVGAAAVWSIVLAEHFRDAPPKTYAKQVAGHLQHDTQTVQQHISIYGEQLASLLALLPFASGQSGDVAVLVARNAATLLKLQTLSRSTAAAAAAATPPPALTM